MDPPEVPIGKPSPRRELQGPRPTPLKVRKDSYKIKKPPVVPGSQQPSQPATQIRPPVIIYTVSPKVIHTNVDDFMTLVQRLTGSSSSASVSSVPSQLESSSYLPGGALSPAAKLATIEKGKPSEGKKMMTDSLDIVDQLEIPTNFDRDGSMPGILSPVPSSLPPISPNFFSPSVDPNSLSFIHDLSPFFHGNKNFVDNTFMPSPSGFLTTPIGFLSTPVTSPFDLFNQFFDL